MTAEELVKSGRLTEARGQLAEKVRAVPTDAGARTLLFQLLAFSGEWDKAERHLDILAHQDVTVETGVQLYRNLVAAERHREAVSRGERLPEFMTREPAYLSRCFAFRERLAVGNFAEASRLLTEIETLIPEVTGTVNGAPFTGFCDTDAFLFPFLEVFIHDRYLWVPFTSLRELSVSEPKTLMDLLWTSARLVTVEGLITNCFLPVLYPGSASHENELVRMGKMTDWREVGGGFCRGYGEHVFQVGDTEHSLLELRTVSCAASRCGVES